MSRQCPGFFSTDGSAAENKFQKNQEVLQDKRYNSQYRNAVLKVDLSHCSKKTSVQRIQQSICGVAVRAKANQTLVFGVGRSLDRK